MIKEIPYIQKFIISKLIGAVGLRYSHIDKDKQFENDLFNYHLQKLVKKGFVIKDADSIYSLSEFGKKIIVDISPLSQENKDKYKFRVNVTTIIRQNRKNGIYLHAHKRKRHPFYGEVSTTGGSVDQGESLIDASKRTILEKTGLELINPKIIACIRLVQLKESCVFQDLFLYVAYCDKFKGDLIEENKFGLNFWDPIDRMIDHEQKATSLSKTIINIYKKIQKREKVDQFIFAEEYISLKQV